MVMAWKEWKELLQIQGGKRSGLIGLLVMMAIFGIVMPIQWGSMWVESAVALSLWAIIPLILVTTMVADSIAGERERHTLETLLASRLSDQAILLGKIGATVSGVWIVTQLLFIMALVPVNLMHGEGRLLFYKPQVLVSGLILSFLLSFLMSSIGVLVSLRAGTVKQAQQTLGISLFIFAYLVPVAGVYLLRFVSEETRNRLYQPILTGDITSLVLVGLVVLTILNVGTYAVAKRRFQRSRLILND
jgi:ABC-2 type transport system permease protein